MCLMNVISIAKTIIGDAEHFYTSKFCSKAWGPQKSFISSVLLLEESKKIGIVTQFEPTRF